MAHRLRTPREMVVARVPLGQRRRGQADRRPGAARIGQEAPARASRARSPCCPHVRFDGGRTRHRDRGAADWRAPPRRDHGCRRGGHCRSGADDRVDERREGRDKRRLSLGARPLRNVGTSGGGAPRRERPGRKTLHARRRRVRRAVHAPRDRPPEWHAVRRSAPIAGGSPHGRARRGGTGFRLAQRALFLGTPEFAVRSLEALDRLRESGVIQIVGVITQPDRPASRGVLREPAVKVAARALGLPTRQPERLDEREVAAILALRPELLVWAAYGNRIPKSLLTAVSGRALNVHASLLPRWRGAAPIARAILAGDAETGVTLMEGTAELDAGPILAQTRTKIGDETRGDLEARLAKLGGELLEREMPRYLAAKLVRRPQDPRRITLAPKLEPREGELDFARPAEELARRVRAYTPDPGAFITFRGQRIGVLRARVAGGRGTDHGTFEIRDGAPHLAAAAGWLRLDEVKPAGRRAMNGAEWARGVRDIRPDERVPS